MNRIILAPALALIAISLSAQAPSGWKTVKDAKGDCQMSVPPDWTVTPELPATATAPNGQGDASIGSQPGKVLKPLNEPSQKALLVDHLVENSAKLVLYSTKANKSPSGQPITPYNARAAGSKGVCTIVIGVRPGVSEETVKKIAQSLH